MCFLLVGLSIEYGKIVDTWEGVIFEEVLLVFVFFYGVSKVVVDLFV